MTHMAISLHSSLTAGPDTAWGELDDACISAVFSKLDARGLAQVAQLDRRSRSIASADILWQQPYAASFPAHYTQLGRREGAPWRRWYQARRASEANWQHGTPCGPVETLRAHSGPIFSTRFLSPPFPPNLALSGGVFGQNEASEVVLWDLDRPLEDVGRLGWRLVEDGMDNLCGVFDLKQIAGTAQVLCCGFGPEVDVGSLARKPPHACSSSRSRQEGEEEDGCLQLGALLGTNLGLMRGSSTAQEGALREGEPGWELRHTHTLVGHDAACPAVACQAEGLVATASFDGTLRLWRVPAEPAEPWEGGEGIKEAREPSTLSALAVLRDPFSAPDNPIFHNNAVCGVALSDDGARLASGGNDMQVKVWDLEGGKVALRLAGHEGWVWHVEALDPAHQVLLSGGTDSSVRTWDTRSGRQVQRVDICTETLYPIAGLCLRPPDQRYIICGVFDGSVHVVDRRQMRVLYKMEGHSDRVTRVCCNGDTVLSGSFDAQVNLWTF